MHRFRESWLALFGGILLLTLSVSSVFGAPPTDAEGNRGQSISTFVHALVFGDEGADEPTTGEEQEDEESPEDELNPDEDDVDEENVSEADAEAASSHGACVSEVARDKAAVGGPNDNHGGAVSEAARVTCWEDEEAEGDEATETESEATAAEVDSSSEDEADRPGKGNGRDKADRPGKAGRGRGHR